MYLKWRKKKFNLEFEMQKFGKSMYKFIFFTSSLVFEFLILKNENWVLNSKLYNTPLPEIPIKFKLFYTFQLSFYITEFLSIFFEIRRKDFIQLAFHHTVSFILLILSFNVKTMKFGLLILFLHNLSDPILEMSKQEYYLMKYHFSNVLFFIFMILFIGLRLLIFPRWLIVAAVKYVVNLKKINPVLIFEIFLLLSLQILNLVWSKDVLKIFIRIINSEEAEERKKAGKKPFKPKVIRKKLK